jgi:hypothetical protein
MEKENQPSSSRILQLQERVGPNEAHLGEGKRGQEE